MKWGVGCKKRVPTGAHRGRGFVTNINSDTVNLNVGNVTRLAGTLAPVGALQPLYEPLELRTVVDRHLGRATHRGTPCCNCST